MDKKQERFFAHGLLLLVPLEGDGPEPEAERVQLLQALEGAAALEVELVDVAHSTYSALASMPIFPMNS